MTIRTTQLAMGYSRSWSASAWNGSKPTCASCHNRWVLTEQSGTYPTGSLKCTKGGFMTAALANCNEHKAGPAMDRDPAVAAPRRIQIGPTDI